MRSNVSTTVGSPYSVPTPLWSQSPTFSDLTGKRIGMFKIDPSIVRIYNQFMGGVDLLDSLLPLYRIPVQSTKWYHWLIFHFIDLLLVQSWLLYRRDADENGIVGRASCHFLSSRLRWWTAWSWRTRRLRTRASVAGHWGRARREKRRTGRRRQSHRQRCAQMTLAGVFGEDVGRCRKPGCSWVPKVRCVKCDPDE